MNERARALGMNSTEFHSVHGLPPGPGQNPAGFRMHDPGNTGLGALSEGLAVHQGR